MKATSVQETFYCWSFIHCTQISKMKQLELGYDLTRDFFSSELWIFSCVRFVKTPRGL